VGSNPTPATKKWIITMLSKRAITIIEAYKKGYRVVDGIPYYKGRKLKTSIDGGGYKKFGIKINKMCMSIAIHRFIAYQKFGHKVFIKGVQVRHLDSNQYNNNDDNIEIGTAKENCNDKNPDTIMKCALIATSFVKIHDHEEIIRLRKEGLSYTEIMKKLNIKSKGTISFIINKSMESKK
jgi:hypothetical protein